MVTEPVLLGLYFTTIIIFGFCVEGFRDTSGRRSKIGGGVKVYNAEKKFQMQSQLFGRTNTVCKQILNSAGQLACCAGPH